MSSLTKCNACNLRRMKERYGADNISVRRVPIMQEMGGWYAVEVTPIDNAPVKIVAYFMELTVECCC